MTYTCRIPVQYGDVDLAKIVYYPRFLHFVHLAMEAFFGEEVGVPYARVLDGERVGYPTVDVKAAFREPVAYGETLEMAVSIAHLGRSSVHFHNRGTKASDGRLAFEVTNVTVAVDMDAWRSIPVPDAHRAAFERHLAPAPDAETAT